MDEKEVSISGLYYQYKSVSTEKIQEHLQRIKIVKESNGKYYPLNNKAMAKVIEKPRNVSLTFDATKTKSKPISGLKEYKTITYLVKSTSRFFLKPDVGEIFDQINFHDLFDDKIKAIEFKHGHECLPDTDGEHFLMEATLLTDEEG